MTRTQSLVAALLGATVGLAGCARPSSHALAHEAYVWQRAWTPAVADAVSSPTVELAGLRVLVAQSDVEGGWREFLPEPEALRVGARRLTAVIRINGQRPLSDSGLLVSRITAWLARSRIDHWSALEIDYDCPTRALAEYAAFVRTVRARLPASVTLSVTALPAWMASSGLAALLDAADRSVLQVHSVSDPHGGLFDSGKASEWISRYATLTAKSFDVALPNYGSLVTWNANGRLEDVISEDPALLASADGQELSADPVDVARLLARLRRSHPGLLQGIVWFRLPVAGDQRIWSRETWRNVMTGAPLQPDLRVEVERDAAGAFQIRLANRGTADAPLPAALHAPQPCVAADGASGYAMATDNRQTTWRRRSARWIRVGEQVRIGWTRCDPRGGFTLE